MNEVEAASRARRLEGLLRELRRQNSRLEAGELLNWLDREVDARTALVRASGKVEAATAGFPMGLLGDQQPLLDRLFTGRAATAAVRETDVHIQGEVLAVGEEREVLLTVAEEPLPQPSAALVSHTASVLALIRGTQASAEVERGYQLKARQLRFAVLSSLIGGDPVLARRMTTGAVPQVLDADRIRIYLLHCVAQERRPVERRFQDRSGYHGAGMMVECPAFAQHLICVIPEPEEPTDDPLAPAGQGADLVRLVEEHPRYALGVSDPHPLSDTGNAYAEALHALAVARSTSTRVAGYRGRAPLAEVLPQREAQAWADEFLAPLHAARANTVEITRLGVTFPRAAVARVLGISRNTVAAHLQLASEALGIDVAGLRARALLDLAFSLGAPSPRPVRGSSSSRATLRELLRAKPAREWAEAFLHPLLESRSHLRETLRAWVDEGLDAKRAAERLGVSRNTVRARLRTAERLLNRDLLMSGSGAHDLMLALEIDALSTATD